MLTTYNTTESGKINGEYRKPWEIIYFLPVNKIGTRVSNITKKKRRKYTKILILGRQRRENY
jgi:hypothetical protein